MKLCKHIKAITIVMSKDFIKRYGFSINLFK